MSSHRFTYIDIFLALL